MSNLELLAAMIHGDQAGGLCLSKNNVVTTTVQDHLFQDGHPIDKEYKRLKKNIYRMGSKLQIQWALFHKVDPNSIPLKTHSQAILKRAQTWTVW